MLLVINLLHPEPSRVFYLPFWSHLYLKGKSPCPSKTRHRETFLVLRWDYRHSVSPTGRPLVHPRYCLIYCRFLIPSPCTAQNLSTGLEKDRPYEPRGQ